MIRVTISKKFQIGKSKPTKIDYLTQTENCKSRQKLLPTITKNVQAKNQFYEDFKKKIRIVNKIIKKHESNEKILQRNHSEYDLNINNVKRIDKFDFSRKSSEELLKTQIKRNNFSEKQIKNGIQTFRPKVHKINFPSAHLSSRLMVNFEKKSQTPLIY